VKWWRSLIAVDTWKGLLGGAMRSMEAFLVHNLGENEKSWTSKTSTAVLKTEAVIANIHVAITIYVEFFEVLVLATMQRRQSEEDGQD
jgi:hypothetical protein